MMIKCPKCDARLDGDTLVVDSGWVDVRDRLPELYDGVLVCLDSGYICESSLLEGNYIQVDGKLVYDEHRLVWHMDGGPFLDLNRITHWMPMPESPGRSKE